MPPESVSESFSASAPTAGVVEPRDAASVIVTRDTVEGVELYLFRRHSRMAFAPGVVAFPGGAVDQADYATDDPLGPTPWGDALGVHSRRAAAIVRAAVREVHEETGLRLATDSLQPWACWVTPADMARRFRTWFFLTRLPDGQTPLDVSGEADAVMWLSARETLAAAERQELDLWPPQRAVCRELYDVGSVAAAIAFARSRVERRVWPAARFTTDEEHVADARL